MIFKIVFLLALIATFFLYKKESWKRILLALWMMLVFAFTFCGRQQNIDRTIILFPFSAYGEMLKYTWHYSTKFTAEGLIGNVLMFMPLGMLLKGEKFSIIVLTALLCSLSIEVIQLITYLGTFEVDDLIHNTFGAVIGYQVMAFKKDRNVKHLIPAFVFSGVMGILSLISILREVT